MDEEDDEKCKKRKTQELTLNQVRDLIFNQLWVTVRTPCWPIQAY